MPYAVVRAQGNTVVAEMLCERKQVRVRSSTTEADAIDPRRSVGRRNNQCKQRVEISLTMRITLTITIKTISS